MYCLVLYDIQDDRKRIKLADACLDFGLDRIQYSAFSGKLSTINRKDLAAKLKRIVGKKAARVEIVPICASDWENRVCIENPGMGYDLEKSTGEEE